MATVQIPAWVPRVQEGLPDDSEDGNARLVPSSKPPPGGVLLRLSCEHGGVERLTPAAKHWLTSNVSSGRSSGPLPETGAQNWA